MPLSIHSFPRAILHIDGDSFFASCEQAVNPALRGKPIITGKERGIASAVSVEAKRLGIKRGMTIAEIRRICPDIIYVPSDYETYSLYSKRMYAILRRYSSAVEEYSIDEGFVDLTGMRRPLHMSYEEIARRVKHDLESELGITFSVGLAPNKVLAKVASKWKKPSGLTLIPGYMVESFLKNLPVGKIWGIGPQTSAYLEKMGVRTALEYAKKSEVWVNHHMSKPFKEIWQELNAEFVYGLNTEEKHDYQSISKTKTFTPSSTDCDFVFSQLSKNVENACIKARRHNLAPRKFFFFLKTHEFRYHGLELTLSSPQPFPHEIMRMISDVFDEVYRPKTRYRATGIVLMDLAEGEKTQMDLFGAVADLLRWRRVYAVVDALDEKFGKHTVFLTSTLKAIKNGAHLTERGDMPSRMSDLLKGENKRQRLSIPLLGQTA